MHYSMVRPYCSNGRIITANVSSVRFFFFFWGGGIFMIKLTFHFWLVPLPAYSVHLLSGYQSENIEIWWNYPLNISTHIVNLDIHFMDLWIIFLYLLSIAISLDEPILDQRSSYTHERHLFKRCYALSDVIDKCNSWLADVTFYLHAVMVTAVERNNQTKWIITFLCCLFTQDLNQRMNKNDVKTKFKYKRWISFFWGSFKFERNGWLVAFILRWTTEKWNLFLNWRCVL